MSMVYWIAGAFLLGLGSGVVGVYYFWKRNAKTVEQDAAAVKSVADSIK